MPAKHGCLSGLCQPDDSFGDDRSRCCNCARMCRLGNLPHQEMQEIIDGVLKTYGEGRQNRLPKCALFEPTAGNGCPPVVFKLVAKGAT